MSDKSNAKEEGKEEEKGKEKEEEGKEEEKGKKKEGGSFWTSAPAILAEIAGVIVAVTGLIVALNAAGCFSSQPTATSPESATLTSSSASTFTPEAPATTPTPCGLPVDSQFITLWDRDRLGCSVEPAKSINLAQEPFERGYMLWREDLGRIYVLYNDGTWQWFRDTWEEGQPEYTCPELASSKTPPTPCRGFGKVWCQETEVRDKIGQAEDKEKGYTGVIQTFQRGLMVTTDGNGIYILYDDGTWEGS